MAMFNNYQPYYNPMYNSGYTQPTYQQPYSGKIYVQGVESAKSYLVAPNASVVLWDSERPFVYEKAADANGVPNMKAYRLVEEAPEMPQERVSAPRVDYLTRDDLEAVYGQINDLRTELEGLSIRRPSKKKEVSEDE